MSILGGPLPEVEEENKEPNYFQIIEDTWTDIKPAVTKAWEGAKTVDYEGNNPVNMLTDRASAVTANLIEGFVTQDWKDPRVAGEQVFDAATGNYVTKQIIKQVPFVKMGQKYISDKMDDWLINPLNSLANRNRVATPDGLDLNPNIMQSKGLTPENSGYSYRRGRALKNPIWDNLPEKTQKKFTDAGMDSDQAKFFIENWEGPIPREMSAAIEGGFSDSTFKFMQSELLPQMLEDMKGVDLSDGIQLDHIAQLRALLPFYNKRNLKQIYKIRRILVKEGIFGGHNPKNLQYLPTDVHTVKTNFWEQQVGKDGSKFFKGRPMRTYADVEKAAKEMKAFINRSNDVVEKVSSQYYLMRKNKISIEELDAILQKVDLNHGPYNLKEVKTLIDEISIDTKTLGGYTGQNTIFSQIVSDNISDLVKFTENNIRGEEALLDVIFKGISPAAALKKYKKFDPTITQGTFNKYLKQARQKDVMEQLRNLRRGKSIPPADSPWNYGQDN